MRRLILAIKICMLLSLVSGCAQNLSPNTYHAAEVGVASKVVHGVIIGKRAVILDASKGDVGALAGAVAGGAGGSAIGGSGQANVAGAVGGAVLGGVVGHAAEKAFNRREGFEYIIKLKDGSIISIAQEKSIQFEIHQKVLVIYGATTRIIPDHTV
jgi:outer membrane lipoprotein SlyB